MTAGPRMRRKRSGERGCADLRIRVRIGRMDSRLRGNDGENAIDVIPAKAGIQGFSGQRSSQTRKPSTDADLRGRALVVHGHGR